MSAESIENLAKKIERFLVLKYEADAYEGLFTDENWRALNTESEREEYRQLARELLELNQSAWHVFDKDDEKTHPPKKGHYWAVWRDAQFGTLQSLEQPHWWHENTLNWSNVTHWQEVIAPVPPQEVKV